MPTRIPTDGKSERAPQNLAAGPAFLGLDAAEWRGFALGLMGVFGTALVALLLAAGWQ